MLSALLRHRLDWERPLITSDDSRGASHSYQKQATSVRCLVQPVNARDRLLYSQRNVLISHQIFFDKVLDLQVGDRLVKHPSGGLGQKIYVVKGWQDQGGQDGRCFMVEAFEQV